VDRAVRERVKKVCCHACMHAVKRWKLQRERERERIQSIALLGLLARSRMHMFASLRVSNWASTEFFKA
jgi:hypothetical protein